MTRDRVSEQATELTTKAFYRPERTGAGVIDPLSRTCCDAFEMRLWVARGDHRLEFGSVFAETVPERSERGGLRRTPRLGKSPGQQRGRTKVFFKVVRRSVALTAVGDRSAGDDHCEGADRRN